MSFYTRHLPHWHPEGAPLFITWRLHGSLPAHLAVPRSGRDFVHFDDQLDRAEYGPHWLTDTRIAQSVVDALRFGATDLKLYELRAWVIMSNHVHILVFPNASLPRITKSIKNFTARQANAILDRSNQPFWQNESYDHWVRNRNELEKIVRYIERNPVKAGLTPAVEDFRWSSAFRTAPERRTATLLP